MCSSDAIAAERKLAKAQPTSDDAEIGFDAFRTRPTPEFPP
jgi:hypothetical protein